jgi:hypothetical protein
MRTRCAAAPSDAVHLPTTDVMRLRLRREHALRKAEKCWA